jgi:hypothetical protein
MRHRGQPILPDNNLAVIIEKEFAQFFLGAG